MTTSIVTIRRVNVNPLRKVDHERKGIDLRIQRVDATRQVMNHSVNNASARLPIYLILIGLIDIYGAGSLHLR